MSRDEEGSRRDEKGMSNSDFLKEQSGGPGPHAQSNTALRISPPDAAVSPPLETLYLAVLVSVWLTCAAQVSSVRSSGYLDVYRRVGFRRPGKVTKVSVNVGLDSGNSEAGMIMGWDMSSGPYVAVQTQFRSLDFVCSVLTKLHDTTLSL